MKKLILAALLVSAMSFTAANAQIKVNLNVNIGSQPDWGPTGYDHVDYYYMPDIDSYYDVPNKQYIYQNGKTWTRSASLPARYRNYDVYKGYKVVVNEPKPYLHNQTYRTKYARYKGHSNQPLIRDSRDRRYQRNGNNNRPQPQSNRPQPQNQQHGKPAANQHGNGRRP